MTLIPVERRGLGTMAVDEYCRLYFDPAFLEGRDLKHLAFVVLHEAIHVWGRHAKRCVRLLGEKPAADRLGVWRKAVDAAVNDVLEQSGLRCPDEGVLHRFEIFPFSAGPTFAEGCQERLAWIWQQEAGPGVPMPLGVQQMGWGKSGHFSMRRALTALGAALELLEREEVAA
jgi:hypothetical protein